MEEEISDLIRKIAGSNKATDLLQIAEVLTVDAEKRTCSVKLLANEQTIYGVAFYPQVESVEELMLITPKVNSIVYLAKISAHKFVVVKYSNIEKFEYKNDKCSITASKEAVTAGFEKTLIDLKPDTVKLTNDKSTVELKPEEILLNGGSISGLVDAKELTTQLKKLTARVDGIIKAIENGVPIPQDGGVGLQKTIVAGLKTIVQMEDFSKIENEKVKH